MSTTLNRNHSAVLKTAAFIAILFNTSNAARAQSSVPQYEVGGQLSVIDLRDSVSEKPPGYGGRFAYNITDHLAIDAAVNYFSTSEVNLNRTQGLFGVKAGRRFGSPSFGLFAKVRPGFIRFHGERRPGITVNGATKFALEVGGVVELYPSRHVVLRLDVGDAMVFYNGETIRQLSLPGGPERRLGTSHNLQMGIGVGFCF
jgi:hypothetical protein